MRVGLRRHADSYNIRSLGVCKVGAHTRLSEYLTVRVCACACVRVCVCARVRVRVCVRVLYFFLRHRMQSRVLPRATRHQTFRKAVNGKYNTNVK